MPYQLPPAPKSPTRKTRQLPLIPRSTFIKQLARQSPSLTISDYNAALDAILDTITDALIQQHSAQLPSIGVLSGKLTPHHNQSVFSLSTHPTLASHLNTHLLHLAPLISDPLSFPLKPTIP